MSILNSFNTALLRTAFTLALLATPCLLFAAPQELPSDLSTLYHQLQNTYSFEKSVHLENAVLQRDRVTITFTNGILYFPPAIAGKERSAIYIGTGKVQASPPPVVFEQENVRRLLKSDDISSDFRTTVLRFTDDTGNDLLQQGFKQGNAASPEASRIAHDFEPQFIKETGINLAARQLESIANMETPGLFLAQFDGGKRGRFTYLFDPQSRALVSDFRIDAGEKGLIFAYDQTIFSNDIWMAFHSLDDYAKHVSPYADAHNVIDARKYDLSLNLLAPQKVLGLTAQIDALSRVDGLRVIDFTVGESLSAYDDERKKKQLHILSARLADGTLLTSFQEPWEKGFTLVLPKSATAGQNLPLVLELKGDFMMESPIMEGTYFPRSTETWYPRHGSLSRSKFDISMIHRKSDHVVSIGVFVQEVPAPSSKGDLLTEFRMEEPVPITSFAVGPYEIHKDVAKEENGKQLPIEFYSMPGYRAAIKEDFILAEMNNCIRFFSNLFGEYPYPVFRGVYHPFNFGQGFPTTIMIPAADRAVNRTFAFIAHETSHQWWGDQVLWRSYRDQWLSEGFAEYSGMLYTQLRDKTKSEKELIERAREDLKNPPQTLVGIGSGRLADVGPLVLGYRLETRETRGAYFALAYKKGALVLRMLHMLFTDPKTGDGQPFFDLMSDFVRRYNGSTASTEQFFAVANEHLAQTALAQKYGYKDLNWFYHQWVLETFLPSYELAYHIEESPSGPLLKGEVLQKGIPDNEIWDMPIPITIYFHGGTVARTTVLAQGPRTPVNIALPKSPEKVELDPDLWVLSEKTSTVKQ
jgi:hypothetical protein